MAAPIKNNLPPQSQQWVRDMERRVADLERENQLLQVTANQNSTNVGSVQAALRNSVAITIPIPLSSPVTISNGAQPLPIQEAVVHDTRFSGVPVSVLIITMVQVTDASPGATVRGSSWTVLDEATSDAEIIPQEHSVYAQVTVGAAPYVTNLSASRQTTLTWPNLTESDVLRLEHGASCIVTGTVTVRTSGTAIISPVTTALPEESD